MRYLRRSQAVRASAAAMPRTTTSPYRWRAEALGIAVCAGWEQGAALCKCDAAAGSAACKCECVAAWVCQ
jgi:hypothetical protein